MALATYSVGRIGAPEGHTLIDCDVVANKSGLADDGKPVVDKQVPADLRARMDVDSGEKPRQMVDQPGEEIEFAPEEPMCEAVQTEGQHTGIEQHFPARSRSRIARLD